MVGDEEAFLDEDDDDLEGLSDYYEDDEEG